MYASTAVGQDIATKRTTTTTITTTTTCSIPQIPASSLERGELIGNGSFGDVYKGKYNGSEVAIKYLQMKTLKGTIAEDFNREAQIMWDCRASNILVLHGICVEPGECAMVMEYMSNESLYHVLHNQEELTEQQRWQIALGMASGLAVLHSRNIIHRDFKSHNVLIDSNYNAKISDFGLAKLKLTTSTSSTISKASGSSRWRPPESFRRGASSNKAVDIYSFGMVLWEMVSKKLPYEDAADEITAVGWIKDGEKEIIPDDCPAAWKEIIEACWSLPEDRPTAEKIVSILEAEYPHYHLNHLKKINENFAAQLAEEQAARKKLEEELAALRQKAAAEVQAVKHSRSKKKSTKTHVDKKVEKAGKNDPQAAEHKRKHRAVTIAPSDDISMVAQFNNHQQRENSSLPVQAQPVEVEPSIRSIFVGEVGSSIRSIQKLSDEIILVAGTGFLEIWNVVSGDKIKEFTKQNYYAMELLPNEKMAVGVGCDIVIVDLVSMRDIAKLSGHINLINCLQLLSSGNLASSDNYIHGGTIKIWDLRSGLCLNTYGDKVNSILAWDRGKLVCGNRQGQLRVLDAKSGNLLQELVGHTCMISHLCALHNGKLASCSNDQTIRIWDPESGQCFKIIRYPKEIMRIQSLSKEHLFAIDIERCVKIISIVSGDLLHQFDLNVSWVCPLLILGSKVVMGKFYAERDSAPSLEILDLGFMQESLLRLKC